MKTVMKKIFSLMLVAILTVSMLPFQASADETVSLYVGEQVYQIAPGSYTLDSFAQYCPEGTVPDYLNTCHDTNHPSHPAGIGAFNSTVSAGQCIHLYVKTAPHTHSYTETITTEATCTTDGLKTFTCECGDTYTETIPALNHNWGNWEVSTAATCSSMGIETRVCGRNSAHTETRDIAIDPSVHNYENGKCKDCGKCQFCGNIGSHPENCLYYCNGTTNCPNDPTVPGAHHEGCLKTKCNKNGCTLAYGHTGECSVPCTVTAGCVLKQGHTGACNTPCTFTGCTLGYQHTGDHSNACAICGLPKIKSPEHKSNCSYYYVNAEPEATPGDSDLEIWVNLHTANVETKTRLLTTYKDLSADTLIYEFISDRRDDIDDMLVNYYGKDYDWSGHVYTSAKADHALKTTAKLGEGAAVYINAYTYQDLVYIYVHTNRSYSNDRVILFEGKQIGDTISRSEVIAAVGKYYSVGNLRMYDESDWKKVVQGKSVDARDNLKVTAEPYHIDVLISGSAIVGSGYTADSTNPKTGDMIMAPAIIMCASIGALATLFYLNKKRAI